MLYTKLQTRLALAKRQSCCRLVRRIFLYFHQLVHFSQGEIEGVFPKDLRRRTATRTKFGAHFWRRLIANIDLAQQFGAEIRRMIPKIHLTQQFGKDLVKHLCISIFEIMI